MEEKRAITHYKDHEIVCLATPDAAGWRYTVSVVGHKGDASAVHTRQSDQAYKSDTLALKAATSHARRLVDDLLK